MQKWYEEQHKDKQEQQLNLFENKGRLSDIKLIKNHNLTPTNYSVMGSTGMRCRSQSCTTLSRPRTCPTEKQAQARFNLLPPYNNEWGLEYLQNMNMIMKTLCSSSAKPSRPLQNNRTSLKKRLLHHNWWLLAVVQYGHFKMYKT